MVRGGYGMFYNRTILGAIDDTLEFGKFTNSSVVQFPNDSADPGPAAGRFPTHPLLVNGPVVNRQVLDQLYPPGALIRNTGVVIFDSPDRRQPYAHQATVGYGRQLGSTIAVQADVIYMRNEDMFLSRNLNPMERANTTRTGTITRQDVFSVLGGEPYLPASVGDGEHRRGRVSRSQPVAGEALQPELVRTRVVLVVEVGRNRVQPGRSQHLPVSRRSQSRRAVGTEHRRSPSHPVDQRADRNSGEASLSRQPSAT